jgi:uncharacterized protein with PQ loop repeat
MTIPSLLGALGTVIGLVRAIPQLVRLLRARESFGVSVDTAATSSLVSFGWAVYGLLTGQPFVTLATGSSGLVFAWITYSALRFGRSFKEFAVAPLWFVVMALGLLLKGAGGLGLILPISVLAANIPQIRVAFKEGNLTDLSLGTWLFSVSDGLVWGAYALLRRDRAILVYGIFQLATSGLIVALKLSHSRKKRGPRMPAGARP